MHAQAGTQAAQQLQHSHLRERRCRLAAGEQEGVAVLVRQVLQDFQRTLGQRHAVFLAALHSLARHRPSPVGEVDLRPLRTEHFASAGCRQDGELKRPC